MKNMNQSEKVALLPSLHATCGGGYCDGIKSFLFCICYKEAIV